MACLGVVTLSERLVSTVLCSMIFAVLLIIGGIEQKTGPVVEVENTEQLLCTGCGRNITWTVWTLVSL